ncbi:phthiodiolone/phenolphthiodiolone dimycocerosates ketoreductase [Amycolatopsis sp. NBRC 101858]|uniref:LLM class flavin-dependent oxidoreductase n=1 Tax=Amycolatopsis sp. NBRC 101858 TaxID=3032200 RepID=UPI0024A2847B|nr:LLM class flavin-dependent oxidoreductase [Amycolatopsis sp. NBRC 101858]GLY44512.1 phthiodiolone/phenolphthiodiolone dimycocerosates ketoreductase [Amycolatopsis sp. NBRC 101858]
MSRSVSPGIVWATSAPVAAGVGHLNLAKLAGMGSLWTVDHLVSPFPRAIWDPGFTFLAKGSPTPDEAFDFATALGHLAARAGNVRLAVGVTDPHRRHPVSLAQTFLTLAHLTRKPPILGLGAGERENLDPYGVTHDRPVARLAEAVQIIRKCFDATEPFDFAGEFFRLDQAVLDLRAPKGRRPEIWLAAHGPRMLELTGRYADGWYPWEPVGPDEYGRRLREVQGAAKRAGRDPEAIQAAQVLTVVLGRDEQHVRRLLRAKSVRYLALLADAGAWRAFGAEHPLGPDFRGAMDLLPHRYSRTQVEDAISAAPDELVASRVVAGTPKQVRDRIGGLVDAGLRHPVLVAASALVTPADAVYSMAGLVWLSRSLRTRRAARISPVAQEVSA